MKPEDRGKNLWAAFTADMQRYDPAHKPWTLAFVKCLMREAYCHPGLLAVVVYRYGQWVYFRCRFPVIRQIHVILYHLAYTLVRIGLQIEIPRAAAIDAGFRIDHFGSIIINCKFIGGKRLSVTHNTLIGEAYSGIPQFGDGVTLSAGAKVIGGITLGNNVMVGAGAVVTKSFPDNAVVVGVPAKLLKFQAPLHGFGGLEGAAESSENTAAEE